MKKLIVLISFLFPVLGFADQPRLSDAVDAFQSAPMTIGAIEKVMLEGYTKKDTSGAVIAGRIGDEGFDGTYFVSIYFEKESNNPGERQAKVITGLVAISAGHVSSVRLIDNAAAKEALFKIR